MGSTPEKAGGVFVANTLQRGNPGVAAHVFSLEQKPRCL